MYAYNLLEVGLYYLIRENQSDEIILVQVVLETDLCLFIKKYDDPTRQEWKKKDDTIFDIIECVDEDKIKQWEDNYKDNEEEFYEDDED